MDDWYSWFRVRLAWVDSDEAYLTRYALNYP